jgi:hypothetical protein
MKAAWTFLIAVLGTLCVSALLVFTTAYKSNVFSVFLALVKPAGLWTAAILSGVAARQMGGTGTQRMAWGLLALGLGLQAAGQSFIAGYQLLTDQPLIFPSTGDAFFGASTVFMLAALFSFCLGSYRSGLHLGSKWSFWWPAPVVGVVALAAAILSIAPVLGGEDSALGTFLNVLYVVYSSVALVPAAVMLRLAIRFRGGRLMMVWLWITVGLLATLAADVLFAWLTGIGAAWAWPLVDWLYLTAYLLIPVGVAFQVALMDRTRE